MSVATELQRIQKAKNDIKTSIINKGVAVDEAATIDTYAAKIDEIQAGGGSGNLDLTGTGWENEPAFLIDTNRTQFLESDLNLTKDNLQTWNSTKPTGEKAFLNDNNIVYASGFDVSYVENMDFMFGNCSNLFSVPDLKSVNVKTTFGTFQGCTNLHYISGIDTSQSTIFNNMFIECSSLKRVPELNTSNGEDFGGMFYGCTSLEVAPSLDTGKGTDFTGMFRDCNLETVPKYNLISAQTLDSMFQGCAKLKKVPDITSSKATHFDYMFRDCTSLEVGPNIDLTNAQILSGLFWGCTSLRTVPAYDFSHSPNLTQMFWLCSSLETLPLFDMSAFKNTLKNTFFGCTGLVDVGGFKGLKISIDLASSKNLSYASLKNVINNLGNKDELFDKKPTLTLSTQSISLLTESDKTLLGNKGWILAEKNYNL